MNNEDYSLCNGLNYVNKLLIEFSRRVVSEIVTQLDQQDVRLVQSGFLAVLIQQQRGSFFNVHIGDGLRRNFPRAMDRTLS
jgi:hypothetical protein